VSVEEAVEFLELLWSYTSREAQCFTIAWIAEEGKMRYRHYCLGSDTSGGKRVRYAPDYPSLFKQLSKDLGNLLQPSNRVYFQVLPLAQTPEKGRGSEKDVKVGRWLWVDFDFKSVVQSPAYEGCREREDYELECYYVDGDKWVHVKRPKLGDVLTRIREAAGLEPSIVTDSGGGYHLYFRLSSEVDASMLKKLETGLIELLRPIGADPKSRDLARILRLPGSWNPRNGRAVKVIYREAVEYDPEKLSKLFEERLRERRKEGRREVAGEAAAPASGWRRLQAAEVARVVEALKEAYIPGHREAIALSLGGWCARTRTYPISCLEIIKRLHEETGDSDPLATRLDAVIRSYRKLGRWDDTVGREVEAWCGQLGVRVPALYAGVPHDEEVRGKRALVETVFEAFKTRGLAEDEARDKAISLVAEAAKVLGWGKSVVVRAQYESGAWIVNDPRRGIVLLREKTTEEGETKIFRKYISDWFIRKVLVVAAGGERVYRVVFKNSRTRERLVLSGSLSEVVKMLAEVHGTKRHNILRDAVSATISELIKRGVARVKRAAAASGIIPVEGGVRLVLDAALSRLVVPREQDPEKARKALDLLHRIRGFYDPQKFDIAVLWAAYAPAGYALKRHFGAKQVYLLLSGERQTGKTTLARLIERLYPLVQGDEEDVPEEASTEYRLAYILSLTTAPVLVDEVQGISQRLSLLGLIKRAATGTLIRWRGDTNRRYYGRAAAIFTSNYRELIADPGVAERIVSLEFSHSDYVFKRPREELEGFRRLYTEYLSVAPHLGRVLLDVLVGRWGEIQEKWAYRLVEKPDYLEFGRWVWRQVAERLGAPEPEWCKSNIVVNEERPEEAEVEVVFEVLHDTVRDSVARYRQYVSGGTLWERLRELYQVGALPGWLHVRQDGVVLSEGFLEELRRRRGYTPVGGLRGLAERLGYRYGVFKAGRRAIRGVLIPRDAVEALEAPEEAAERLAHKYLPEFTVGGLPADSDTILKVLVEREGYSEEEAKLIVPHLVQRLRDILGGAAATG